MNYFNFPKDITLIRYSERGINSELVINYKEYENHSELDNLLNFGNIFKTPFINRYYSKNPDILRYFEVYHQDDKLQSKDCIKLKKSFNFDDGKIKEPDFLCENSRLEIYKYLDIEDIKNLSLASKEFLSDLRKNKTIKFLKTNSKLKFFKIMNHIYLQTIDINCNRKEYELWWLYSMNSYFNVIRKRWLEFIQDIQDIYQDELESLNMMERMINSRF